MTGIIGAIVIGIIIGIIGTNVWRAMPTGREREPRYYRHRLTGHFYQEGGRAHLADVFGESGDLLLMARSSGGQEAWPEKRIREEFEQVPFESYARCDRP